MFTNISFKFEHCEAELSLGLTRGVTAGGLSLDKVLTQVRTLSLKIWAPLMVERLSLGFCLASPPPPPHSPGAGVKEPGGSRFLDQPWGNLMTRMAELEGHSDFLRPPVSV